MNEIITETSSAIQITKLAAKACGIEYINSGRYISNDGSLWIENIHHWWNPLLCNEDAFKLMVELRIRISFTNIHVMATHELLTYSLAKEITKGDTYLATRTVISHVAAKIGEMLK